MTTNKIMTLGYKTLTLLVSASLLALLASCGKKSPVEAANEAIVEDVAVHIITTVIDEVVDDNSSRSKKRILPLGDSITDGSDGYQGYRRPLWFLLRNADYNVDFLGSKGDVRRGINDFDLDHEGHGGWEAGEVEQKLPYWLDNYETPDIVLLHLGTNDIARNQSVSSTINEIDNIINILRERNSHIVILLAEIIPMRRKDVSEYNRAVRSFAARKNSSNSPVVTVDQTEGYNPFDDSRDNYHPNEQGEEIMANHWYVALRPYL